MTVPQCCTRGLRDDAVRGEAETEAVRVLFVMKELEMGLYPTICLGQRLVACFVELLDV